MNDKNRSKHFRVNRAERKRVTNILPERVRGVAIPRRPANFFFYKDLTQTIPKAFQQCLMAEICQRYECIEKVSLYGTHKFVLLQALSLTVAPWLYHQKVIRELPDMLPQTLFSVAQRLWSYGPKYAQMTTI